MNSLLAMPFRKKLTALATQFHFTRKINKTTIMKRLATCSLQKFETVIGILLLAALPAAVQAQNITITGRVTNDKGEPVPRASVTVKGSTTMVNNDETGNFQLTAPSNGTLVVYPIENNKRWL